MTTPLVAPTPDLDADGPDADLLARRADFPALSQYTWLQNGGVSLVPRPVHAAHVALLEEAVARGPLHIAWPDEEYPRRAASRAQIARFLGVGASSVAFTRGVSEAFGHVLRSIDWKPGDELVITDDEEAALGVPALQLRDVHGVVVRRIPLPPEIPADAIADAAAALIGPRTRLVAISHVTTDLGVRLPAEEIVAGAEGRGVPVFLDTAHSVGTLPVDVTAIGASYTGVVSYKWMLSPYAAGALVVRPDRIATTRVVYAGGRSERYLSPDGESWTLHDDARRFEMGPWSWPLIHAWAAAADYLDAVGVARVAARADRLLGRLTAGLAPMRRVRILTPAASGARAALFAFAVEGWPGTVLERYLRDTCGIRVRALLNRHDGVRASVAFFTLASEVDALIDAVAALPAAPDPAAEVAG